MNAVLRQQELPLQGFYHSNSVVNPLTAELLDSLIEHEVFDPQYNEYQNGLRGIYKAELEAIEEGWQTARVIHRMYVAYSDATRSVPVAVAVACPITHPELKKHCDFQLHIYVKPEYRRRAIASRMVYMMRSIANLPGLAMEETPLNKQLLHNNRSITPLRRASTLDRHYARCMRTLERDEDWINREGSRLSTDTIRETLIMQHELIAQLRKELNPHDNSVILPS